MLIDDRTSNYSFSIAFDVGRGSDVARVDMPACHVDPALNLVLKVCGCAGLDRCNTCLITECPQHAAFHVAGEDGAIVCV